jgi:hypothetical protein
MPDRSAHCAPRPVGSPRLGPARNAALRVLLAGAVHRVEFQPIVRWLESCTATTSASQIAAFAPEDLRAADLAVVFQSRPGELDDSTLSAVRAQAPLLRVVLVVGPWCEGERRRGAPPEGVWRLPWHRCRLQLQRALDDAAQGRCPAWGEPLTAGAEEWYCAESHRPWPGGQGTVLIAARGEMVPLLIDVCRAGGYVPVAIGAPPECWSVLRLAFCVAAIWEGTDGSPRELLELSALVRAVRPAHVVALLDFPRGETLAAARGSGASAVLGKPVMLGDLYDALGRWSRAERGAMV